MNKESNFHRIFPLLFLCLGLISFSMIFFEAFFTAYDDFLVDLFPKKINSYTGVHVAFGYNKGNVQVLRFNILAVFAYLFPLIAGLISVIRIKGIDHVKFFSAAVLFLLGGVLLFLLPVYVDIPTTIIQIVEYSHAPLIAGILSVVASFGSFYYMIKL